MIDVSNNKFINYMKDILPGLLVSIVVALVGIFIAKFIPKLGAGTISIFLGMFVGNLFLNQEIRLTRLTIPSQNIFRNNIVIFPKTLLILFPKCDILYYVIYIPSKVKSYVTAVWANSAQSYSYDYATGINGTLGDEMLKYAEHITYGADTAVFVTEKHAMVCFGVEFKQYAADKNDPCWNGWDARLMIYDVNNFKYNGKAHNKYDYVYVNLSDGSSSYPFPDIYGTSHIYKLIHTPYKMISQNLDEFFPAIRN